MTLYCTGPGKTISSSHGGQINPFNDKCHLSAQHRAPISPRCFLSSIIFYHHWRIRVKIYSWRDCVCHCLWHHHQGLPTIKHPQAPSVAHDSSPPLRRRKKAPRPCLLRVTCGPHHSLTAQKPYCSFFFRHRSFTINPN